MKRTLERVLKVPEIAGREAFGTNARVCCCFGFPLPSLSLGQRRSRGSHVSGLQFSYPVFLLSSPVCFAFVWVRSALPLRFRSLAVRRTSSN